MNPERDILKFAEEFFPFTLGAWDSGYGWSRSPTDFQGAFMANKPEGLVWYAYDVEVKSPTLVEFTVYDMACNVKGGIGRKIAEFGATVEPWVTQTAIEARVKVLAQAVRDRELARQEERKVEGYADDLKRALKALETV